ncbi:MAG TPA: 50S ribosomal protein L34 [Gammaproteobacteria bacterium]|nr:50S ribosomal protein L34 [Gammaproteobacteria bacterium]
MFGALARRRVRHHCRRAALRGRGGRVLTRGRRSRGRSRLAASRAR